MSEETGVGRFQLPLTPHGRREMLIFSIVLVVLGVLVCWAYWPLVFVPVLLLAWVISFFRDPERKAPDGKNILVAPADGKVVEIAEVDEPNFIQGRAIRISIFLSVFNVHINRSPCSGLVRKLHYRPGRFRNALLAASSEENESNSIGIERDDAGSTRIVVRQIAGAIARRIVCSCNEGDRVKKGERVGMIKFGSRTELYVSADARFKPEVHVGQNVKAGSTVMGEIE